MSKYAPDTEEVRKYYRGGAWLHAKRSPKQFNSQAGDETYFPEFDRWLSELISKEREDAWTEGFDRGFYRGQVLSGDRDASEAGIENPYRKE